MEVPGLTTEFRCFEEAFGTSGVILICPSGSSAIIGYILPKQGNVAAMAS